VGEICSSAMVAVLESHRLYGCTLYIPEKVSATCPANQDSSLGGAIPYSVLRSRILFLWDIFKRYLDLP